MSSQQARVIQYFKEHPGVHRIQDLTRIGIHHNALYRLRDQGMIVAVDRGIYRLADENSDARSAYTEIALRVPKGVFCLISALDFHNIGSQIPYQHWIALPAGAYHPTIENYSVRYCSLNPTSYEAGIEEHLVGSTTVRVYSPAKTCVDCFKFRNQIGLEVVLEALRETIRSGRATIPAILQFANACRMKRVMMPYLEGVGS